METIFRPTEVQILSTFVWVHLPAIPLECFTDKILRIVAKYIGRPVKEDSTTIVADRGKYARICVEVDLAKPLVPSLCLDGQKQQIEYEGLHQIYFMCGQYGHRMEGCYWYSEVDKAGKIEGKQNSNAGASGSPTEEGYYGPWMLPNRGRRRNSNQQWMNDRSDKQGGWTVNTSQSVKSCEHTNGNQGFTLQRLLNRCKD